MRTINKKILILNILIIVFSLNLYADWQIIGAAVSNGEKAVFTQDSENSQEFVYIGKLTNQQFKITDGIKTYVQVCGDNDPLEQSITLREETEANETGMRIRYVGEQDYFKVTLTIGRKDKSLIAERITPPNYIYIMGGPFNLNASNWLLEDAVELEKSNENPFVFYYKGEIHYNPVGSEGGSIKFLLGRSWSENYHPDISGDIPLNQVSKMRLGGEDNKWYIPADRSCDGYYVIKINTLDLTISIEEFVPKKDETPLAIFITGDAMSCGWSNTVPKLMNKIQAGIYQWEGTATPGQFKFLQRKGTWGKCYVATSPDEQVMAGSEHNIVYEENYLNGGGNDYKFVMPVSGDYKFTVNLNTMKMRVDETTTNTVFPVFSSDDGIVFYSNNGKLYIKSNNEKVLHAVVYSIDGKIISYKSFADITDIALPKGFYIVHLNNSCGDRIKNIKTLIY
jgi:hypothetical protein